MATESSRIGTRGAAAKLRKGVNLVLRDGAARERINRGLARANFELIIRPPVEALEPEFERCITRCSPYTMTTRERLYSVYQAVRYIVNAEIAGDIAECGVWRGGSAMMAASALLAGGDTDRRLWLYDTFTGMPEPGTEDTGIHGEDAHAEWERNERGNRNEWCYSPEDDVRANMLSTGLTAERIEFVAGMVEDTIPARLPEAIALLRLDTDWYESTRHELEHMFPRLSPGGVLIIDDYGHWAGVRKAVDEYLGEQRVRLLLNRIDYAGRMATKPIDADG